MMGPYASRVTWTFWTSIRREWAWRLSRGESTANLEAFRAELEADDAADAADAADSGAQGAQEAPEADGAPRSAAPGPR